MKMKVGLDAFTIRNLGLSATEMLDFVNEQGLEGVQCEELNTISPSLDRGELKEFSAHAKSLGLYVHVSVPNVNPHGMEGDKDAYMASLRHHIELCHMMDFRDVRSKMGSDEDRFRIPVPWKQQLDDTARFLQALRPLLKDLGVRLNLEDHADNTTHELAWFVEEVGDDVLGVCLDTANVMVNVEDPLEAAKRVAPYVRLTHAKDAIVYLSENGLERQVRPAGQGVVPWDELLTLLGSHNPDLTLSIEDHKEFPFTPGVASYTMQIYDAEWLSHFPDLKPIELAKLVQAAYRTRVKLEKGEIPPVETFAVPWEENGLERIHQARNYLRGVLGSLSLAG